MKLEIVIPDGLHESTQSLVVRFAEALAAKLHKAELKYGYSGAWESPGWIESGECRVKLMQHIEKGDPRDVAVYCAFLWHHGASTSTPEKHPKTMSNEKEMMKCDWCGKEFPADARACVEAGIDAYHPPEDGEEWKGEEALALNPEEFSQEQREHLKTEMQLDDAQLDELLRKGKVEGLGAIVCLECQDSGQEDAEAE